MVKILTYAVTFGCPGSSPYYHDSRISLQVHILMKINIDGVKNVTYTNFERLLSVLRFKRK